MLTPSELLLRYTTITFNIRTYIQQSSWHHPGTVCSLFWPDTQNEFLYEQSKFIRDWRRRALEFVPSNFLEDQSISSLTDRDTPLISTVKETCEEKTIMSRRAAGAFISLCPREETLRGALLSHTTMSMKHFIAQCTMSDRDYSFRHGGPNKSTETIFAFVKRSKELFSMFSSTCI